MYYNSGENYYIQDDYPLIYKLFKNVILIFNTLVVDMRMLGEA